MIEQSKLEEKIKELLDTLYQKRFSRLHKLTLKTLLQKNPYLYCSLGINDAHDFMEQILAAFISSSDETIFGNGFFEPLALWAAKTSVHNDPERIVTTSAGAGQDISIENAHTYFAIAVKSGKNIFNAQSTKGQNKEIEELRARLRKNNKQFRAIIGYSYGRSNPRKESNIERSIGQEFWKLLTGEEDFYTRISNTILFFANQHGEEYKIAFERKINELLRIFMLNFVNDSGTILWNSIVEYNSSEKKAKILINPPFPS